MALTTSTVTILLVTRGPEVRNFKQLDPNPFITGTIKLLQMSLQMSTAL